VPKKVDQANLHRYGVIKDLNDQKTIEDLYSKGFLCSSGSIMRLAQKTSHYHLQPKQARGILLTEHRRCFDEIIEYCNKLAYSGLLEPMKGSAKGGLFPPLQFIPVRGQSKPSGTSRANIDEAQAMAQWLATNQHALEQHYQLLLKDIVAIVTPFTGQKFTLRNILRQNGIDMNDLTIGTVHALQGAERPVILFSSTYGSNDIGNSYFFDAGVNMLNVAVSRAKDSFILFGCEEIFRRKGNAPSMLLYNYIKTIAKL
jgi:superfamily I DNA and/or RNA helicase